MSEQVDLYNNVYGDFGSTAEAMVRHEAFGEDIGQSSWLTAAEWLRFADQVKCRRWQPRARSRQWFGRPGDPPCKDARLSGDRGRHQRARRPEWRAVSQRRWALQTG